MSRPIKQGLDYFPLWKPQRITESRFRHPDYKIRRNAIRNSSSSFIKREDVRRIVFKRDNYRCVFCSGNTQLTIDHIISVYRCAKGQYPIEKLNIRENLQTLCGSCNSKKHP